MNFNNKLQPIVKPKVKTNGKSKDDFLNAFFERYQTDTYGLYDDYEDGTPTTLDAGENAVWEQYNDFLKANPQYQQKDFSEYFDIIDKQKK